MTNSRFSLSDGQEKPVIEANRKRKGLFKSIVNNRISSIINQGKASAGTSSTPQHNSSLGTNHNDLSKLMQKLNTVEMFKDEENEYDVIADTVKARSYKELLHTHQEQSIPKNKKKPKMSKKDKSKKKKNEKKHKK